MVDHDKNSINIQVYIFNDINVFRKKDGISKGVMCRNFCLLQNIEELRYILNLENYAHPFIKIESW